MYAISALAVIGVLYIVITNYLDERADFVRTPSTELSKHPAATGIPGLVEVSLAGGDGEKLAGWYAPSKNRAAVVLVHGTGADRSSLLPETRFLAAAGFGVFALDLPGQGASGGRSLWGIPERKSVSTVIDWLSHRDEVDPARIGGYGLSMGAYIMTQAAALDERLRAVILVSSPTDVVEQNWLATTRFGWLSQVPTYLALRASGMPLDMRPIDVVGRIAPRAVFLISGTLDTVVPPFMARQLYAAAHEPKEEWVVSGANHINFGTIEPQEYPHRVIDFYRRKLLN